MSDLTLDCWRALVHQLGERSPDRRALADAELERLARASATDWAPLAPEQVAAELRRAFHGAPSARQERSAVIAEALADAAERSATRDVAQALGVAESRARALIAEHRAASARPDTRALAEHRASARPPERALAERQAVSAR